MGRPRKLIQAPLQQTQVNDDFIGIDDVRYLIGGEIPVSRSTINRLQKEGVLIPVETSLFLKKPWKLVFRRSQVMAAIAQAKDQAQAQTGEQPPAKKATGTAA